jgi:hypothetical protein
MPQVIGSQFQEAGGGLRDRKGSPPMPLALPHAQERYMIAIAY